MAGHDHSRAYRRHTGVPNMVATKRTGARLAPSGCDDQRLPTPFRDMGVDAPDTVGRRLARGRSAGYGRLLLWRPGRALAAHGTLGRLCEPLPAAGLRRRGRAPQPPYRPLPPRCDEPRRLRLEPALG